MLPESAEELLDALLGTDPLWQLERLLVERTEGNPFFLEERARTLVETKVLMGERDAYRLVRPLEGIRCEHENRVRPRDRTSA